ncbi:DUF4382 domain-containing protein [Haloarcula onubensis]|uniref:DUF4382 domain-containing protein n=1 Tax=Haloarcula onubensis TaxID=2950539 RepID=A0ABU2FL19_9EURY|nr:DUF4382 domain-containing protein [Halomicroarcula sp. S3CR25-11]MDS0281454.1 DUF4382 domain-containing protein [Halomicroarcula sp. S3CR25-11]
MDRRTYLKTAGVTASAGLVAGCSGSTDGDGTPDRTYGTLATSVTDVPGDIGDFDSCVVTIAGIWVTPAGSEGTETGEGSEAATEAASATDDDGRRYIEFEEPQTADLVQLQGSNTQSLGETELETGTYQSLQLDVTGVEGTLDGGEEASVETPGNAPLKFNAEFEIRAEERTHFVADFTPVERGNGSYLVRPVASGTTVLYGDAEYTATDAGGTVSTESN